MSSHTRITKMLAMALLFMMVSYAHAESEQISGDQSQILIEGVVTVTRLNSMIVFNRDETILNRGASVYTTLRIPVPSEYGRIASVRNFRITKALTDSGLAYRHEDITIQPFWHGGPGLGGITAYYETFHVYLYSPVATQWSLIEAEMELLHRTGLPQDVTLPPLKEIRGRTIRVDRPDGGVLRLQVGRHDPSAASGNQIELQMSQEDWPWVEAVTAVDAQGAPIPMQSQGGSTSRGSSVYRYSFQQDNADDVRLRFLIHRGMKAVPARMVVRDVDLPTRVFVDGEERSPEEIVVIAVPVSPQAQEDAE